MREAALNNPAFSSEPGAVLGTAAGDHGLDPAGPQQPAVLVVVITAIGDHDVRLLAWSSSLASDRPGMEIVQQRQQLGDVVAVAGAQRDRERNTARVNE